MAPGRHDRDSVTTLALDLLDRVGLPDLSMRRLAAELDVQPSALYWHFASKQELLAAVADRILSGVPRPSAGTDVAEVAAGIRDALLAYRDGAEVVMSTYALRLGTRRAQDALQTVLGDAASADALFEFVLGHTTLVQQRMHAQSVGATTEAAHDPTQDLDAVFRAGIRAFAALSPATDQQPVQR
ncbi:TetR family transcriptional regulator [Microbacterium sp. KUDC0406]|uniref:TetR family transcriptional regulator n=1 Tax=Microbacterium sp. KUDC0406 TaxID=2909588 RepID=UPI001F290586|nr:TetR family transcriptional regulator [Microbacterium sp. KUDC0406]UJP10927.1 TetR family transcriptional regulator [Microbacterium sp. KUDC0406]